MTGLTVVKDPDKIEICIEVVSASWVRNNAGVKG